MSDEPVYIPDFRFIGKAFPEERDKLGVVSCTIGYSKHHNSLIRFPELPPEYSPNVSRWVAVKGLFGRKTSDSRAETYVPVDRLAYAELPKLKPTKGFDEISAFLTPGFDKLLENGETVGVVRPVNLRVHWEDQPEAQGGFGIKNQPRRLKAKYLTEDGKPHDSTILDWQFYEAVRQFTGRYEDPYEEAVRRLKDPAYDHLFVVGNIYSHRHRFTIVGVVSRKLPAV
jgi:hypothetical protein